MWREEVGITEMMLAYIGEFAEFQGWSSWRTVVIDILTCHEEVRRQRRRPIDSEQHVNSNVATEGDHAAIPAKMEMDDRLSSSDGVQYMKDVTSDRMVDLTTEVGPSDVKLEQYSDEYHTSDTNVDETVDGAVYQKGVLSRTHIMNDESGILRHADECIELSPGERLPGQGAMDSDIQVQALRCSTTEMVPTPFDEPDFASIEANLEGVPVSSDSFDGRSRRSLPSQYRSFKTRNSNENSKRCNFCLKMFKNVSNRRCHERIHTGEKPFPCSFCPKRFIQSSDRRRHEITHTSERPYLCSFCDQNFRCRSSKWRHERTHHCKATQSLLA